MMKNSFLALGLMVGAVSLVASAALAEEAAIAVDSTPLKAAPSMTAKTHTTLAAGTKVNKIAQKGDWIEIEATDATGAFQKGYVRAATITTNKSVMSKIGTGQRVSLGAAKGALGAAGKGKTEASAAAMDGMLDDTGTDTAAASEAPAKAASSGATTGMDRIDAIKIGDAELMAFMKAGGLKSRILK